MSLCRTPVQVKTERARKLAMIEVKNMEYLRSIVDGADGKNAPSVDAVKNIIHTSLAEKYGECEKAVRQLMDKVLDGDFTVTLELSTKISELSAYSVGGV